MEHPAIALLERRAELIGEMQTAIKRQAMIYQYDAKMQVAAHYGLTLDDVNLPYPEWAALRERYTQETGNQL